MEVSLGTRYAAEDQSTPVAKTNDAPGRIARAIWVVAAVCAVALLSYFVHVVEINVERGEQLRLAQSTWPQMREAKKFSTLRYRR